MALSDCEHCWGTPCVCVMRIDFGHWRRVFSQQRLFLVLIRRIWKDCISRTIIQSQTFVTYNEISIEFNRAFYGNGTDEEKSWAAYDLANFLEGMGNATFAYYYELIGDHYRLKANARTKSRD